jgi:hypothetical protein
VLLLSSFLHTTTILLSYSQCCLSSSLCYSLLFRLLLSCSQLFSPFHIVALLSSLHCCSLHCCHIIVFLFVLKYKFFHNCFSSVSCYSCVAICWRILCYHPPFLLIGVIESCHESTTCVLFFLDPFFFSCLLFLYFNCFLFWFVVQGKAWYELFWRQT